MRINAGDHAGSFLRSYIRPVFSSMYMRRYVNKALTVTTIKKYSTHISKHTPDKFILSIDFYNEIFAFELRFRA